MKKLLRIAALLLLLLGNTASARRDVDIGCMARVVEDHENALISAWDQRTFLIRRAMFFRREDLVEAWRISDSRERGDALRRADKTFRGSSANAEDLYSFLKKTADRHFSDSEENCGG